MSFILWSMGLVLALFVGCLAWRIVFYLFALIIGLFVTYPKWMLGIVGTAMVLPVVVVVGIVAWVNYFEPPIVHYNGNNQVMTSPSPTQQGLSPQGVKVLDDFLKNKAQQYKDEVKAQGGQSMTVRRAELVKP